MTKFFFSDSRFFIFPHCWIADHHHPKTSSPLTTRVAFDETWRRLTSKRFREYKNEVVFSSSHIVQKLQNFSTTQIFREINFGKFRITKVTIFNRDLRSIAVLAKTIFTDLVDICWYLMIYFELFWYLLIFVNICQNL